MQIENSFSVGASPDAVFAFLLDVNRVVGCVPGAELSEVVDRDTFRGKVRIKVGPVTVSYNGTAHITARDEQARTATLQAEGRETTGSGSARATTTMSVVPEGEGVSAVTLATDFTVVGRVAQFGRGIMEEVSRKLIGQMGECIREQLEAEVGPGNSAPAAAGAAAVAPSPVQVGREPEGAPVDALALARSVAVDRLRAVGTGRLAGIAVGLFAVFVIARRLRRHTH
jgi:carbon monoxide dehydrogenase subunit G